MNTKKYVLSLTSALVSVAISVNLSAAAADNDYVSDGDINRDATVTLADIGYSPAEVLSNADSGFLFSDQLDANNTAAYKDMEEYLAAPSDKSFTVKLSDSIVLERSSRNMNNWSDEEYTEYAEAVLGAVMPGVIAFTLDYPEVFWLNFADIGCGTPQMSISYNWQSTKPYKITISEINVSPNFDSNYTDFDTVLDLRSSVAEEIENFTVTGDTDYEKCKSIYQSIIDITEYDISAPYAHGIAGVLYDGRAVCEGYSKAFKILCDRENIPCISVLGNYNAEELTAHMWNYVYLDGAWYGCDPTFDETTGNLTYFMRGSDFFNKSHRPESPYSITTLLFPDISASDYISVTEGTTETTPSTEETTETTTETTTSLESTTVTSNTSADTSEETSSAETTTVTAFLSSEDSTTTTTTTTTATTTSAAEYTTSESSMSLTETTVTTETSSETTTTSSEDESIVGDINGDGEITVIDIIILRKYLLGISDESVKFSEAFDCNGDGSVNIFDAAVLMTMLFER